MSEYQYYEFQTLDRPLTATERAAVGKLSSHIKVSATSASVEYNRGDFKHDPRKVVASYFDAMIYLSNWNTHQLIFRFPKAAVEINLWKPYLYPHCISIEEVDDFVILDLMMNGEGGSDWIEADGLLSEMVQLRADLLRGDLRALYVAWLQFASYDPEFAEYEEVEEGDEDDDNASYEEFEGGSFRIKAPPGLMEPAVPPGLQTLTPALLSFIDFFEINPDLVTAAAAASPALSEQSENLAGQLPLLTEAEKNDFLVRLLKGEPRVDLALTARLRALQPKSKVTASAAPRRTLQSLIDASEEQAMLRKAEARRKEEAALAKKMQALAPQEPGMWRKVNELIALKNVRSYEEAIEILKDLRELALYEHRATDFKAKIADIRARYPRLPGLQERLNKVF